MIQHKLKIVHNTRTRTVTLRIQKKRGGWNAGSQQISFSEREFFRALKDSDIVIEGRVIK